MAVSTLQGLARVSDPRDVRMTYEGNELRQLRGDGLDRSVPPWQDDRWWIRLPARMIHGCPIILRKMHAGMGIGWIFLAFLPFALRSRLAGWESKRVFAMNLLTLPGLEALLNFSTELMGLSSRKLFTDVLNQILPNVFPLIVSVEIGPGSSLSLISADWNCRYS